MAGSTASTTARPIQTQGGAPDGDFSLTPRQREVAILVARGLTNRQIAQRLVISERTAMHHVGHILDRLGVRSRAQIAAWAAKHGLQC
ncbi:MAG TPA: LuxR C-terminal-related transcriptional regulator [Chloroflexota bacterium]|nr:LuxR C-terminal-related transcriptional regulator [Chloroflexota bacterium]